MRRRDLLGSIATGGVLSALGGQVTAGDGSTATGWRSRGAVRQETIGATYWDSTSSLLTASMEPITSDEHVLVRAMETATSTDEDGNGDAVAYEGARPVLAARDGRVVGLGAMLVDNEVDFAFGNDEFLLNVWDAITGDGGTVVWDTGHGQYWVPSRFSTFISRAEEVGYTVTGTDDITGALGDADLAVITTPPDGFSDEELSALSSFRQNGGAIVLHDQSDFDNLDQTDNMNAIASALRLPFRFNDDQVTDDSNNAGAFYQPKTSVYLGSDALFAPRKGVPPGPQFSFDTEYTATVTGVSDGDTFDVEFADGATEEVRVLGIDTPEVAAAADAENPSEWEGLGDEESGDEFDGEYPYLQQWANEASTFAEETLLDKQVTLTFDENEGIEGPFGRLLAYTRFDADGSGSRDRYWSDEMIERGLARVYDSGNRRHDGLIESELAARSDGTGVWAKSDPTDSRTLRNESVEQLFFPNPVAVETFGGELPDERVAVRAPDSASTAGAPLVAVDTESRVAAVGGVVVEDDHFGDEFPLDPTAFGNEPFLTSLADALTDTDGFVAWDGGHGQFDSDAGVSVESASAYQRYLEGVDLGLEQVNDYTGSLLQSGRALIVSPATSKFTGEQLNAIRSFRDNGGAVIVLGAGSLNGQQAGYLNALLAELGSDLTLDTTPITDSNAPEGLVTTSAFNDAFGLFDAFETGTASLPTATPTPTPTPTPQTATATTDTPTATAGTTGSATSTAETTADGPGFGTLTGLAGAVGGGLVALRRMLDDETDDT